MKKNDITHLDIAEYLDSEEMVAEYLNLICRENDPALLLRAIGHVARSKGMAKNRRGIRTRSGKSLQGS
jgi:probable addiction module antidote protein